MIVVNSSTRQFNIPGADLVFGVESDSGSERKYFQCPRYVGNNLDIAGSFVRMNYRNANGEIDEYLVEDVAVEGDNVTFSWELKPKVTMYKGNISFVMCVVGPDTKVKWHTTLGRGQVLEGLEPDNAIVEEGTADVVAQLIAMVETQTAAVEAEGEKQIKAVQTAAKNAESDAVAEIEAKGVNTRNSIPADYTALSEAVDSLTRGRAGAIVCSAEGSAVVVSDSSDLPMQGLRIFGRSTQDGTPTPDAPVEIKSVVEPVVTVAGKNLFDSSKVNQDYFVAENELHVTPTTYNVDIYTGVSGSSQPVSSARIGNLPYLSKGTYTISFEMIFDDGETHNRSMIVTEINADGSVKGQHSLLSGEVFTLEEGTLISLRRNINASATIKNLQIELGSETTSYEPYKALQTVELAHTLPGIPVTSGGNYTDGDGQQWVCDEVDFARGKYVQRIGEYVVSGRESWSVSNVQNGLADGFVRYDCATALLATSDTVSVWTHFPYKGTYVTDGYGAWVLNTTASQIGLRVVTNHKTVDDLKTFLTENSVTCKYVLATPIETPLSETEIAAYRALHSNYPNTTVLNDAGAHMVVKYAADTKLYIDNKITALIGG